jgi:TrmH family RNA methyltransferase
MPPIVDPERLAVVLVAPMHEGNVGAAARALKNLAIGTLRLTGDLDLSAQARAMACDAQDVLAAAERFETLAAATADCALAVGLASPARERRVAPVPLADLGPRIAAVTAAGARVALVFGREDSGLSADEASHCGLLAYVPLPGKPTLNLAQAVLLAGYELTRGGAAAPPTRAGRRAQRLAPAADLRAVAAAFADAFARLGYGPGRPDRLHERMLRRGGALLARAALQEADVHMLLGLARRIRARLPRAGAERDDEPRRPRPR